MASSDLDAGSDAPVITIDGPSGSGKGTVSLRLARRLGWRLLDSGALYRVAALAAERKGVSLEDGAALGRLVAGLEVEFASADEGEEEVWLNGEEVSTAIRSETCGNAASRVAAIPAVREALLERQRAFRDQPGLVADGRDMGTVVFPRASLKIFLTASVQERAERRYKQLMEKGIGVNLARLLDEIAERDRRDTERATAPLRPAEDAVVVDTSGQKIEAVLDRVLGEARARGLSSE